MFFYFRHIRKFTTVEPNVPTPSTASPRISDDERSVGIITTNITKHSGKRFIEQLDAMYEQDIDSVFSNYLSSGCILNYNQLKETNPASQRRMNSTDICMIPFYCQSYESFNGAQETKSWVDSIEPNMKTIFVGIGKSGARATDLVYLDIKCTEMNYSLELIDDIADDFSIQLTQRIRNELDIRAIEKPSLQQRKKSVLEDVDVVGRGRTASGRLTKLRNLFARKGSSSSSKKLSCSTEPR